jgi:hypothetical protein
MWNTQNIYIAVPTGNGDACIQSVIMLVVTDHGANLRFAMAFTCDIEVQNGKERIHHVTR